MRLSSKFAILFLMVCAYAAAETLTGTVKNGTTGKPAAGDDAGVTFVKGTDFDGEPDTLRLAYSFVSVDEIAEGVSRLAAALAVPV